ncbi:MAG: murein DD-endopeptidase MepM/ murein hydrolase activator NlpD [Cocleimonas sp.]|jgi:murein DD-endopeptidase MepM/ murein hydrolase activator NlpD
MKKLSLTILLLFNLLFINTTTNAFPANSLRPGGIGVISVIPSNQPKPFVSYKKSPVALIKGQQNWLAVIGIALSDKPGSHEITIKDNSGKTKTKRFNVKAHQYKTQRLTIKNKNKVNPNKKSSKRIEREYLLKQKLKKTFSSNTPKMNFIKPVSGRDSGRFGLRRILNKQKRNPHSGMDIAAPEGRKIKAAESGKVIFVGDLFFTGKVIYLDHGNGLISLYAHLSKSHARLGQQVKRGELIARVGKTGRVTGAHLHWTVYLNGNAVDPALFIGNNK